MSPVIINPGTEGRRDATLANAEAIVARICNELEISPADVTRKPAGDRDGFFCFRIKAPKPFEIDVPGDDPYEFWLGQPFRSRRMYVDGSSWLITYALSRIEERLEGSKQR